MANEAFDKFKHDMTAANFAAAVTEAITGEPEPVPEPEPEQESDEAPELEFDAEIPAAEV